MPAGLLSSLFSPLSCVLFPRAWKRGSLRLAGLVALICLAAAAHAQTAQFSYALQTLVGGLYGPQGVAVDASGNLYVGAFNESAVTKVPSGCTSLSCVTTVGGGFSAPLGVAVDASGKLYVADFGQNAVLEVPSGCTSSSCVIPLGGGFNAPEGIAVDSSGNVYVADTNNNAVKRIPANCLSSLYYSGYCTVTTLGGGFSNPVNVAVDSSGYVYVAVGSGNTPIEKLASTCTSALYNSSSCTVTPLGGGFRAPYGIALDGSGNVYVADRGHNAIKKIPSNCTSSSCVTTLGSGFNLPAGVAADGNGNIYVGDNGNDALKEISSSAVTFPPTAVGQTSQSVTLTFTFTTSGENGPTRVLTEGALDGDLIFAGPACVSTYYSAGDTCTVPLNFSPKFAGLRRGAVELRNGSGQVITTAYVSGIGTGPQAVFNAPLASATLGGGFSLPAGVAVDGSGNVYVADNQNSAVKEIPSGCTTSSCVLTLGGGFSFPQGVAVDGAGNVYVGDSANDEVKEIPNGCTSSSCVLTIGGGFHAPQGVAVDGSGNVYVGDTENAAIKEIPSGCASSSCVRTLASLSNSTDYVAVDGDGNVYFTYNKLGFRQINEIPSGCMSSSCVTALGGGFSTARGVAVDGSGNLYVADSNNNALKVMPSGCTSSSCVTTLATGFNRPYGVALDGSGNLYVGDTSNNAVKKFDRVDAPLLSFATATAVGSTDSTDGPQTVTLANIGNQPLSFPVPASGYNPNFSSSFVYDEHSTCTQLSASSSAPATLAAGATCTLGVDFAPTTVGNPLTGSVAVADNSLNNPSATLTIPLSGVSTAGAATFGTMTFSPTATVTQGTSQIVTISDTVSYGGVQPTGSVTFNLNGINFIATCTATGSPETCSAQVPGVTIAGLGADSYTVSATLSPDSNYNAASGTNGTFTVNKPATVPVTVSASPANSGISFTVDGQPYTTAQTFNWAVGSQHTVSVSSQIISGGYLYVFAKWSGGTKGITTDIVNVTANTPSTLTALFNTGYQLTISAGPGGTVAPVSGNYYEPNSSPEISATPNPGYVFSGWTGPVANPSSPVTTVTMTGPETVSASFVPAAPTYDTAITVQYANTTLTYPGATNITVCIAAAKKITATGSVQILDGSTVLTTQPLQGGGCAYWYISPGLAAGTHVLSAVYSGDKNNPGGVSAKTNIVVNPVPANLGVACWNASFAYGANYECTVSASSNAGSAQGVITYSVDGGTPIPVAIANGTAEFTVTKPLVGSHTVNIAYAQQTNYAAATAPTQKFTVTPAPVVVALTPSSYYTSASGGVTFEAAVSSWSAGVPDSIGAVSFYDGSKLLATVPVNASGQASYSTKSLSKGSQAITAAYVGTNYAAGSTTITLTLTS